ncbi:hypothetical protein C8T65DRAFT_21811 [Cerioporus squamosus]|nr:hypothetical protein C8T65DRAFT_21811 [Cerioporus squamosus]
MVEVSLLSGSPRTRRCRYELHADAGRQSTCLPLCVPAGRPPTLPCMRDLAGNAAAPHATCTPSPESRHQTLACLVPMDVSDMAWSTRRSKARLLLRSAKHANSDQKHIVSGSWCTRATTGRTTPPIATSRVDAWLETCGMTSDESPSRMPWSLHGSRELRLLSARVLAVNGPHGEVRSQPIHGSGTYLLSTGAAQALGLARIRETQGA